MGLGQIFDRWGQPAGWFSTDGGPSIPGLGWIIGVGVLLLCFFLLPVAVGCIAGLIAGYVAFKILGMRRSGNASLLAAVLGILVGIVVVASIGPHFYHWLSFSARPAHSVSVCFTGTCGDVGSVQVPAGESATYPVEIRNTGTKSAIYTVSGCPGKGDFSVEYSAAGHNITSQVEAGTYPTGMLSGDDGTLFGAGRADLEITVGAPASARGQRFTCGLTAMSGASDSTVTDTAIVKFVVTASGQGADAPNG